MKSKLFSLAKNDYVHAGYEAILGALAGYIYPILNGAATFNMASAKLAIVGAVMLGLRKAISLYLTNSEGQILTPEKTTDK